jgi:hypothetical protein
MCRPWNELRQDKVYCQITFQFSRSRGRAHEGPRRVLRGAPFLGFYATPERVRVRRQNLARGRRRMQKQAALYRTGALTRDEIQASVRSWFAHLARADTVRLRRKLVADFQARIRRAPR